MNTKRILSVALLLAMIFGLFSTTVSATDKNRSIRHEICTSLSEQASVYYAANGFTFTSYAALNPGNESCLETVDSELYGALSKLMTDTMTATVGYQELTGVWRFSDCENGGDVTLFYSDIRGNSYNREHVWPKSRASFLKDDGGADPHHLRPTDATINSTRNNYTMGNVKAKYPNCATAENGGKTVLWLNPGHSEDNQSLGLVEVNDNIKGDVARIFLYVYTRWNEPNLFENDPEPVVGLNDDKNTGIKVIESLETLLQWCEIDPVDEWEMSRNDICEEFVGNRNVFIDYPEFAWLMFGLELPENMRTPSGEALKRSTCSHTASHLERVEPSCIADGKLLTLCDACGKRLACETIASVAHNFVDSYCSVCGLRDPATLSKTFLLTKKLLPGDDVVIVCSAANIAFSSQKLTEFGKTLYNAGVEVHPADGKLTDVPEEIIWTVGQKDGNYTFSFGGKTLTMGAKYSNTNTGDIYDTWATEAAKTAGASYIKNVGRNLYLEWDALSGCWNGYANAVNENAFALNFYVRYDPDRPWDEPDEPDDTPEKPNEPEVKDPIEYKNFSDVKESDWFYDNVVFAVENGLMNGVGGNRFAPNGDVTRGMLVTILYRNEGEPDVNGLSNPFSDVKKSEWYGKAIIWAAENKIVNGISKTAFAPNSAITREQIATILYRYADFCGIDTAENETGNIGTFSDSHTVSSYAKSAVKWAVGAGIINGMDGKLAPTATATRAQLAAMLERYLDL